MPFEIDKLSDQELSELHQRTSAAVKGRERGPQLEDIKPGMKPEDMRSAEKAISAVLAALNK